MTARDGPMGRVAPALAKSARFHMGGLPIAMFAISMILGKCRGVILRPKTPKACKNRAGKLPGRMAYRADHWGWRKGRCLDDFGGVAG